MVLVGELLGLWKPLSGATLSGEARQRGGSGEYQEDLIGLVSHES